MNKQTHKGIGGIWGKRTGYLQDEVEYLGWHLRPMCIPQGCLSGNNALYWDEGALRQTAWTQSPVPVTRCRSRDAVVQSVIHVWLCDPVNCSTPGLHVPSLSPRVCSNSCPLSPWCHPNISSSLPLLFLPSNFTGTRVFSNELVLPSGGQCIRASAQSSVISMNIQGWFPCCSRDSQEFSPTPQFKSNNSLVLIFLSGPTLTSIRDYWKIHSFDYMDLYWQTNVSAF